MSIFINNNKLKEGKMKLFPLILTTLLMISWKTAGSETLYTEYTLTDFANGDTVTQKIAYNNVKISEHRTANKYYAPILKKYKLGYHKPILQFLSSAQYTTECIWLEKEKDNNILSWKIHYGWGRPGWMGDSFAPGYALFFIIVVNFSPPEQEVHKMYAECIRIFEAEKDDCKRLELTQKYLKTCYDHYNAAELKKTAATLTQAPDNDMLSQANMSELVKYIQEHRSDYPKILPDTFWLLLLSGNRNEYCFQEEYLLPSEEYYANPSEKNAYLLATFLTGDKPDERNIVDLFKELQKRNLLSKFLKQIMPSNLPPLPAPKQREEANDSDTYYTDSAQDAPSRHNALQLICNYQQLHALFFNEWLRRCSEASKWHLEKTISVAEKASGQYICKEQYTWPNGKSEAICEIQESPYMRTGFKYGFLKNEIPVKKEIYNVWGKKLQEQSWDRPALKFYELCEKFHPPQRDCKRMILLIDAINKYGQEEEIQRQLEVWTEYYKNPQGKNWDEIFPDHYKNHMLRDESGENPDNG